MLLLLRSFLYEIRIAKLTLCELGMRQHASFRLMLKHTLYMNIGGAIALRHPATGMI